MKNWRHSFILGMVLIAVGAGFTPFSANAADSKLSLYLGNYNYSVSGSGSASGIGNYFISYAHDIFDHWQAFGGMTLILSKTFKGEAGFGFDVGTRYYPFTAPGVIRQHIDNAERVSWSVWRPFSGVALRQRQFSLTTQASYVGLGILIGVDRQLNERFSLSLEAHYDRLSGAGTTSATQLNVLLGGSLHL